MDVNVDLLAVSPWGITIAKIVDPGAVEKAVVHNSLDPLESWLLTTPDGAGHPLPNPVPATLQGIRGVKRTFSLYQDLAGKSSHVRFKGMVVFPDEYDVSLVKSQVDYDTASTAMRVIHVKELAEEIAKPLQPERMNPERCRNWLCATILRDAGRDSIGGTWLEPDRSEPARRAPAAGERLRNPRLEETRKSDAAQPFGPSRPASRSRTGRAVAGIAGLSLAVTVLAVIVLWQFFALERPGAFDVSWRSLAREGASRSGLSELFPLAKKPEVDASARVENKTPSEPPGPAASEQPASKSEGAALEHSPAGLPAVNGNAEERAHLASEAHRKIVEHRIDEAIRNRAVGGVRVAFVNDTAYLAGEVLSENQKTAAERAARTVPEVKQVRSSIAVLWNR